MKLGEMLVRDGRLTTEQLDQSIAQQKVDGGRLGTVMVEMGFIDLDTLTVYLGVELSTPIASKAALEKAKKRAVNLLKPDEAAHYRCVPLVIQERLVIVALDDPHDMESLDELLRITGYRVLPRVAPEARIHLYLERYYGIRCAPRYSEIAHGSSVGESEVAKLPARPLPGLPKMSESPIEAPNPAPVIRSAEAPAPAAPENPAIARPVASASESDNDSFDEIELEAADLLFVLDSDEEEAERAAVSDSFADEQASTVAAPAPCHEEYRAISVADTLAAMEEASGRNEIAKLLMAHASGVFDVSALCIIRDNMAFGWRAYGENLDRARIETLLLPLDRASIFASAVDSEDKTFSGTPFQAMLHKYLFKVLCCPAPQFALVRAICIGNRVVNVFYGHRADGAMSEEDIEGTQQVCSAAKRAYVRMITKA
ncbi:MAG: hypothetical protein GY811_02875 [Myxococcales bacterium]|nr:hypothetical protein [Myxococcales bacterium]